MLRHIRAVSKPGIYVLLDFHHYLRDPVVIRLMKDICLRSEEVTRQLVLLSHEIELPAELTGFAARFDMALPTEEEREAIVRRIAGEYADENPGSRVRTDAKAFRMLIRNLAGLTDRDTEQLARNAIFHDGAITQSDLPGVMQAKYELLNRGGILQFEYDTARFGDVGGLENLKRWLEFRKPAFTADSDAAHLDVPKGILLIGVQGCGKSLAAKATAGIFGLPLLRLDFARALQQVSRRDRAQPARITAVQPTSWRPAYSGSTRSKKGSCRTRLRDRHQSACLGNLPDLDGREESRRCSSSPLRTTSACCHRNWFVRAGLTNCFSWTCLANLFAGKYSRFTSLHAVMTQ